MGRGGTTSNGTSVITPPSSRVSAGSDSRRTTAFSAALAIGVGTGRERIFFSRTAFIADPTATSSLMLWQQANHALQTHIHDRAQAAAVRAGVLWQHYGEQSTHYFYHLSRQRQQATVMSEVADPWGQTSSLSTAEGRAAAGQTLADFFSSDSPHGLFRPRSTVPAAQQDMLAALDSHLTEEATAACEAAGTITLDELSTSLDTLPRGKRPGRSRPVPTPIANAAIASS